MDEPELNMQVAQKVMGLIPCDLWTQINLGMLGGPALQKNCNHDNCYSTFEVGYFGGRFGGCPHYSSNIQAAWEVVEHMISEGWKYQFHNVVREGHSASFMRGKYNPVSESFPEEYRVTADTLPAAICLAALRAYGVSY